jgi:hypothetical protein
MHLRISAALLTLACLIGESLAAPFLVLSGVFEYRTDFDSLEAYGDTVCFIPSPQSAKLLPRSKSDERAPWLCFSNHAESKTLLGIQAPKGKGNCGATGNATIRVGEYVAVNSDGSCQYDTARLQAVIRKSKQRAIPCN